MIIPLAFVLAYHRLPLPLPHNRSACVLRVQICEQSVPLESNKTPPLASPTVMARELSKESQSAPKEDQSVGGEVCLKLLISPHPC